MPEPLYADLIFPSANPDQPSISRLLSSLRRANLSVHNRLTSIRHDAAFATAASVAYARPLVANERCGSWYVEPGRKRGSAYFKSTDGHERAWKFSTRRLNLHLLELVEAHDGVVVVDSTRRGKRMPDALSTTVPIWCAVVNRVLFPADDERAGRLFLPAYLPATTHAQISALLPGFVASLRELKLEMPTCLTKPLRPFWVTQDSPLPETEEEEGVPPTIFEDYRPVICCTASRRVLGGSEMDEAGYIQGAGDDTENWAHGLTPPVFWAHADELLATAEADLPERIEALVREDEAGKVGGESPVKELSSYISVCPLPLGEKAEGCCYIALTEEVSPKETWVESPVSMKVGVGKSKAASRNLRLALPDICSFAAAYLKSSSSQGRQPRLILACHSGKDISVGTALALSCFLLDDEGNIRTGTDEINFTKTLVKVRLGKIMTVYPEANPSRSTLQAVNSFLMDWRK